MKNAWIRSTGGSMLHNPGVMQTEADASPIPSPAVQAAVAGLLPEIETLTGFELRLRTRGGLAASEDVLAQAEVRTRTGVDAVVEVVGDADGDAGQAARAAQTAATLIAREILREAEVTGLAEELLDKYEEISLLYGLAHDLGTVFDPAEIGDVALRRALQTAEAARGLVAVTRGDGAFEVVAAVDAGPLGTVLRPGQGITGAVAGNGRQALLHPDEPGPEPAADERRAGEPVLAVPLVVAGDAGPDLQLGAITLSGRTTGDRRFTAGDAKVTSTIAAQLAVSLRTAQLVGSLRATERLTRDLEIAAGIQRTLLPAVPPRVPSAEIAARCVPAANVGGDYYDHIIAPDGRLFVLVADVAGHSIGSALMMAMARTVLRRAIADGQGPAMVLRHLDEALFEDLDRAELFITAFCAAYDMSTGELCWANGGHNRPVLIRRNGTLHELDADGVPAGILPGATFEEPRTELGEGDVLVLYTDGVVEARDGTGRMLGDDGLHHVLREAAGQPAGIVLARVTEAVNAHRGGGAPDDDETVLVISSRARRPLA
jgi:serine phosphatase RsbU (regulator of sigma subunit)